MKIASIQVRSKLSFIVEFTLCVFFTLGFPTAQAADNTFDRAELASELRQVKLRTSVPVGLEHGITTASTRKLPHFAQWLSWVSSDLARFGSVSYRNETLVAGEKANIQIQFVVGTRLTIGSSVAVLPQWAAGVTLQAADSRQQNYIEVRALNGSSFKPVSVPAIVPFSSWFDDQVTLGFEVQDKDLEVGDRIDFVISNLVIPGKSGAFSLPVAFSQFPARQLMMGSVSDLVVSPNQPEFIEVIAPSRVGRGATIDVSIILKDRYGNPSPSAARELDVLVDGTFLRRIELNGAVSSIEGLQFSETGMHNIEVRAGGGGLRGSSNPIFVQSGNKQIEWVDVSVAPKESNRLVRNSLRQGGTYLSFNPESADVALPFIAMDERGSKASRLSLVQIAAGESQYEWFAQRFYNAGYRLGVAAGGFSPLPMATPNTRTPLTAILSLSAQDVIQAQGRSPVENASLALRANKATYATTGAKIVIHSTVNGASPGKRVKANKSREIAGWVQGTGPIDRIELVKNGELSNVKSIASSKSSKVLKVSVKSSSEPFKSQRDLPRNAREWIGFIRSNLSTISILSNSSDTNSPKQAIAQNGAQRVDFITWTHGGWSSFLVELGELSDEDVIELNLRAGYEDTAINPSLRPPSQTPASRQMVPVFELVNGPVTRQVEVNGYQDLVRFELVDSQAADYSEFVFRDVAPFAQTDYYYLRVIQLDDQVAWTSPVFVGGFDAP